MRRRQLRLAGRDPQALQPVHYVHQAVSVAALPARTVYSRTLLQWLAVLRAGAAVCPIIASDFWQEMEVRDANRNCCWVTTYNTEAAAGRGT